VKAAGANWDAELDADTSVRTDGDPNTACGPGSSHAGVMALVEALGVTPPARPRTHTFIRRVFPPIREIRWR
jgi:mevalonate pyrophosphate decarboxylase